MKNSRAFVAIVSIAFVLAIGAMAGHTANAANPPVGLGTAATYSVLAGTPSITNTGNTTIDRDVGIHPADSITGFPPGIIGGTVHAGDAVALQAKSDLTVAYLDAQGRSAPLGNRFATLSGRTLVGGVYNANGATLDLTGTLTLNGQNDPNSVWIFQATSDLVTASTSSVVFINGGSPCNVFWQVTSSATLGSGSHFVGTILALDSITLANGVTVNGRALARNGLVSLINDTFITSTCNAAPPVVVPPGTRPPFTTAPSATPAATPIATAAPSVGPTTAPTAAPVAAVPTAKPAVAGKALPSTSTGDPSVPLTMLGIALTGIGILLLRSRSVPHL